MDTNRTKLFEHNLKELICTETGLLQSSGCDNAEIIGHLTDYFSREGLERLGFGDFLKRLRGDAEKPTSEIDAPPCGKQPAEDKKKESPFEADFLTWELLLTCLAKNNKNGFFRASAGQIQTLNEEDAPYLAAFLRAIGFHVVAIGKKTSCPIAYNAYVDWRKKDYANYSYLWDKDARLTWDLLLKAVTADSYPVIMAEGRELLFWNHKTAEVVSRFLKDLGFWLVVAGRKDSGPYAGWWFVKSMCRITEGSPEKGVW